jgi:hypothetical protein
VNLVEAVNLPWQRAVMHYGCENDLKRHEMKQQKNKLT